MWKSLPTDYCTRLISWLCNDFVTLTTIIDFQGVRKDWNCPPIPEKKSEKTQNLSFSVWLLTRLFFLPSTDHKTLFCWSVPLGLPQAGYPATTIYSWRLFFGCCCFCTTSDGSLAYTFAHSVFRRVKRKTAYTINMVFFCAALYSIMEKHCAELVCDVVRDPSEVVHNQKKLSRINGVRSMPCIHFFFLALTGVYGLSAVRSYDG